MDATKLIWCPQDTEYCNSCEFTVNEEFEYVGACGYKLTTEDKHRILMYSNKLRKEYEND